MLTKAEKEKCSKICSNPAHYSQQIDNLANSLKVGDLIYVRDWRPDLTWSVFMGLIGKNLFQYKLSTGELDHTYTYAICRKLTSEEIKEYKEKLETSLSFLNAYL